VGALPTIRRRPKAGALILPVLLLASAVCATASSAATPHRPACGALRGKRLSAGPSIKLIEHADEAHAAVYACLPPHGRVHLLGVAHDETIASNYDVTVSGVAATWLALLFRNQIDPHTYEDIGKACNVASGHCYRFFAEGFPEPSLEAEIPQLRFSLLRVVIGAAGNSATAIADYNTTQIAGFGPGGAERLLDSAPSADIPSASLQIAGGLVHWTDGGAPRSAAP
jgi:hypothetical protein